MTYTYDFGDDWVHSIKLEKILASDDGDGQLPRCTAGRGAAPAEDSGGTWGWANIVEAVNDPRHEEHKEYREWLGMLPGETLDPKPSILTTSTRTWQTSSEVSTFAPRRTLRQYFLAESWAWSYGIAGRSPSRSQSSKNASSC